MKQQKPHILINELILLHFLEIQSSSILWQLEFNKKETNE